MIDRLDEVQELLEEIYDEIDKVYFNKLNGGIVIEENICYHPRGKNKELICLGAYRKDLMGRSIVIYYGSIMEVFSYLTKEQLKEKLREVLLHELTHHLEFLAGENDLVIEDEKYIKEHLNE